MQFPDPIQTHRVGVTKEGPNTCVLPEQLTWYKIHNTWNSPFKSFKIYYSVIISSQTTLQDHSHLVLLEHSLYYVLVTFSCQLDMTYRVIWGSLPRSHWPVTMLVRDYLDYDSCGRAQPTVGGTIPRQVGLSFVRKGADHETVISAPLWSLPWLLSNVEFYLKCEIRQILFFLELFGSRVFKLSNRKTN